MISPTTTTVTSLPSNRRRKFKVGERVSDKHPDSRLSFVEYSGTTSRQGRTQVIVQCDCGSIMDIATSSFTTGNSKSCGCFKIESSTARATRHGYSGTKVYGIWKGMIQRTTLGSYAQKARPNYVGVNRDPRWDKFESFIEDMGDTYFEGACLGRTGDIGDYEKSNCRWQTKSESTAERNITVTKS
jgi:hypothetical protein